MRCRQVRGESEDGTSQVGEILSDAGTELPTRLLPVGSGIMGTTYRPAISWRGIRRSADSRVIRLAQAYWVMRRSSLSQTAAVRVLSRRVRLFERCSSSSHRHR